MTGFTRKYAAYILLLLGCLFLGGCGGGSNSGLLTGDPEALANYLREAAFEIREGDTIVMDMEKLFCEGILPCGYGNNLATPYICLSLDELPGNPPNQFPWTYRLRQDEALVLFGKTPPACVYFGMQEFLGMRYFPEKGYNDRLYAMIGDATNHLLINSRGEKAPFDADFVLITTGNKTTEERVVQALEKAGYQKDIRNLHPLPAELVHFGLDEKSDQFNFLLRAALIEDENTSYWEDMGGMKLLRLTPEEEIPVNPYDIPDLRVHGTGDNEFYLTPALNELEEALKAAYPDYDVTTLSVTQWLPDGLDPLADNVDTLGATSDTTYLITDSFALEEGDFVMACGVLHDVTEKALYNNVTLYGWTVLEDLNGTRFEGLRELLGVAEVNSKKTLAGSALPFIPNNSHADRLYALKVSRNGTAPNENIACLEVPAPSCDRMKLQELALAFRAYCEPETKIAPAYTEILHDRAFLFRPKKQ